MPIYEFHCDKCDADFEQLFRSSDAASVVPCPECGAKKTRRKLSIFGMSVSSRRGADLSSGSGRSSCTSCARSSCAGCRR